MIKNLNELLAAAKERETMKLVVAAAQDADVLGAVCSAAKDEIVGAKGNDKPRTFMVKARQER